MSAPQSVLDALANAETLRLALIDAGLPDLPTWRAVADLHSSLHFHAYQIADSAAWDARAAFRAVPGLREE